MPVITYSTTCLRNERIAPDIWEFTLQKPEGFTFKPGQFVLFDVALIENPSDVQTRAFSIASTPNEQELLFVAKMLKGGRASRWIEEVLRPGVTVSMKGPFGRFLLDRETQNEYLFIATSTGNAPFRSQILSVLSEGDTRRIDFVFGVRTEADLFWVTYFEDASKKYPNFFLHVALSQPSPAWTGHKGRVQTLVPQITKDFSRKTVYVCGSPDMTKELKERAMHQWGVDKKNLHVEGYI